MADRQSEEEWRGVQDWADRYEVSSLGRVRSVPRVVGARSYGGRVLKPTFDGFYERVTLYGGPARKVLRTVHGLVAAAFIGPRPESLLVCHEDGNPRNNAVSNLRYDTYSGNGLDVTRHGRNRLALKTECVRGHPLAAPNLRGDPGGRRCLACARARYDQKNRRARGEYEGDFEHLAKLHLRKIMGGAA